MANFLCILQATIIVWTGRELYKSDFDFAFSHRIDLALVSEQLYLSLPLPNLAITPPPPFGCTGISSIPSSTSLMTDILLS